jgi:hypothetical protein
MEDAAFDSGFGRGSVAIMAVNITFNGVDVGDYGWMVPSTTMPDTEVSIPRAHGIRLKDMGGGSTTITIRAWVSKATRAALEQYYEALPRSFGTAPATLVVNSVSYTNVKFLSLTPDDRWQDRVDYFTATFKKSAATQ